MDIVLKRCVAMFLDMWIAGSIPLTVFLLMDQILNLPDIVMLIFSAAAVLLLLLKDLSGRSIGKRLLGLQIVNCSGGASKPKRSSLFLHNITLPIWIIEILFMEFSTHSDKWIDRVLKIRVIDLHPKHKGLN